MIGSTLPYLVVLYAFVFSTKAEGQAISCHSSVNISLDQDCTYLLQPSDILSFSNGGVYSVQLTTATGAIIEDNTLRDVHLWTSLTAKVTQAGNSCWGTVRPEDKLGPEISCVDRVVECFDTNEYVPMAMDNCSEVASVELIGNEFEDLNCDPNFSKIAIRRYKATDAFGNTSTCSQTISFNLFNPDLVIYPESFKTSTGTNLTCNQVANTNGIPDVNLTGTPYVLLPDGEDADSNPDTLSLYPFQDVFCNISVDYRDIATNTIGCKKVIMRTWLINEWSCNTGGRDVNQVQTLEISDSEPPSVDCGAPFVTIPLSGQGCSGTFNIELPTVSDDCSSFFGNSTDLEIDIRYSGDFINNATQGLTIEVIGGEEITYIVYDDCGNFTTCKQVVTLDDETEPVAICDFNSVVSLRNDGTAVARTSTFDDGSFDNCETTMMVIKRQNSNCPCENGDLDGFDFIGEENGSFFYLSNAGFSGTAAFNFANALDGNVANISNPSVLSFLTNGISPGVDSIYVGLTVSAQGVLTWSDHSPLTDVNMFANGQLNPDGSLAQSGSFVILNANGELEIVSGGDALPFLLEVTDPCGFSSTIDFCCADAGANMSHTVELRAIDATGNFGSCTSNVVVQDKVEPIINCPPDMNFDCAESIDFTDKALFGDCTFSDNCTVPVISGPIVDVNLFNTQCSTGKVTRTFTVSDSDNQVTCMQTLTAVNSQPFDPASIVWPDNLTVTGCDGDDFSPEAIEALGLFSRVRPTFTTSACSNVAVSVSKDWTIEAQFVLVGGTCSQILRTWTIIDWCGPLVDGVPPTYEWQQIINITESEVPEILRPTCDTETFSATTCMNGTGMANFNFAIFSEDNCSTTTASVVEQLFYSGTPTLVATNIPQGGLFASNTVRPEGYPVGDHKFIISVKDVCGNESTCEKLIRVQDTRVPTVSCNDLSIPVQIWNNIPMVVLNAELLAEVTYGCAVYIPRFSFSSTEIESQQTILCDEINGAVVPVTVYVTDDFGLNASCQAQITVTQQNLCGTTGNNANNIVLLDCQAPNTIESFDITCDTGGSFNLPFNIVDELNTCPSSQLTLIVVQDLNSDGQDLMTFEGENSLDINVSTPGEHTYTITGISCDGSQSICTRQISVGCTSPTILDLTSCVDEEHTYPCDSPVPYNNLISVVNSGVCGSNVNIEVIITHPNGDTELIVNVNVVDIFIDPEITGFGTYTYTVEASGCGNTALCTGSVLTFCTSEVQNAIAGTVITESAQVVKEVELVLEGANVSPEYTDVQGTYAFGEMPAGGSYKLSGTKNIDPLNGVSTIDLVLIQRHILGVETLDSPYKKIAADIDNSGSINGIDLIELRKLILGIYSEYPDNNSWRIIDATQDLGQDPFVTEIKENYIIPHLDSDMQIDFIGVKVGDVDQSFEQFHNGITNQRSSGLSVVATERTLEPGIEESIIIGSKDFTDLYGIQMELDLDTEKVAILGINPIDNNLTLDNFNTDKLSEGNASMVWHNVKATSFDGDLFEIVVLPFEAVSLSSVLSINEKRIMAEAYSDQAAIDLNLTFYNIEETTEMILMQNSPNPWSENTEITYYLPQAIPATLSIYDISGRLVYKEEKIGSQGLNTVMLDKESLNAQGILYYELVTENGRKIQKMILME